MSALSRLSQRRIGGCYARGLLNSARELRSDPRPNLGGTGEAKTEQGARKKALGFGVANREVKAPARVATDAFV